MQTKLYLAYGSNLNLRQMARRCPSAELLGYTYLEDTRLIYRGSLSGYYLSIEDAAGCRVPCGVFRITPRDERNLDRYEGYPNFYGKVTYKSLPLYAMGHSAPAPSMRWPTGSPAVLPPGCLSPTTSVSAARATWTLVLTPPIWTRPLQPQRRKCANEHR